MVQRIGKQTWVIDEPCFIKETATVVGPDEYEGPLGHVFDDHIDDLYAGQSSWEKAEQRLVQKAVSQCIKKAGISEAEVDLYAAGDLMSQLATSYYAASQLPFPFLGAFSACATSMQLVALTAMSVSQRMVNHALISTSSHYGVAEKQFRLPIEHVKQRPKTAMKTVTGAGAALISSTPSPIAVQSFTFGRVIDWKVKDPTDLGQAMAPAAFSTIDDHLQAMGESIDDYDAIVTGDLSMFGSTQLQRLFRERGVEKMDLKHIDCGQLIYGSGSKTFAGGSGAACCPVVTFSSLFDHLRTGKYRRIFVVATGAIVNRSHLQQGETIPCVAHGVVFARNEALEEGRGDG
ncbi:stage V sporulation protein AD [Texcoconibacillus texcoconensis]|uniref:Stage V sporulation protein AD n=1 Tax=Texcoconibacillus texcoconensis TaxID=1095777 RepID=A0A840QNP8_9BACI|nr:stage V sporulation protein AD [Texcoconibacillus texcoconensis]MBB5172980.1 stage V sporulation protein AD [Texcoconibacillus texcoconensis]